MKSLPRIALTALAAAGIIAGIVALGAWLRDGMREQYSLSIQEVECEPPPGKSRDGFLGEVHYYGQLPERLNTLDGDLPDRLQAAFAKHPDVFRVEKVTITDRKRVHVDVVFRKSE